MKKPDRILIVAGDSDGNVGDLAIVLSMCEAFTRLRPELEIAIMSNDPARDQRLFPGIKTIRRGPRGLPALLREAGTSDLVVCGGGGLFQDDDSLVKMPYWALRLLLLRLCCRRIVGYAIGAGPLRSPLGQFSARLAFACMERITVRDGEALCSCRDLTSKPITILPDPAIISRAAPAAEATAFLRASGVPLHGGPLIGVALRRWFHRRNQAWIPHKYAQKFRWRRSPDHPDYQRLIILLARVLDRLAESCGTHVVFMPTYNVAHEADDETCRRVLASMRTRRATILAITDPRLYKAVSGQLAVMLGGRMHPAILAAGAGTPVVGLSYNQKFKGFFNLLAMGDRVMDIESFVRKEKTATLAGMLAEAIKQPDRHTPPGLHELTREIHAFNHSLLMPAER
jgi:polysaccharide pyruvyl transferase WcaK-like protein